MTPNPSNKQIAEKLIKKEFGTNIDAIPLMVDIETALDNAELIGAKKMYDHMRKVPATHNIAKGNILPSEMFTDPEVDLVIQKPDYDTEKLTKEDECK